VAAASSSLFGATPVVTNRCQGGTLTRSPGAVNSTSDPHLICGGTAPPVVDMKWEIRLAIAHLLPPVSGSPWVLMLFAGGLAIHQQHRHAVGSHPLRSARPLRQAHGPLPPGGTKGHPAVYGVW
jgi:hypothetical protein